MTDKATVQVPSPVHGKVLALGGKMGEVMAVGSELISLEVQDEDAAAKQPSAPVEQPRPAEAEQPLEPEPPVRHQGEKPLASPSVRKHARDLRSAEHTSELQALMRTSYADFCLSK